MVSPTGKRPLENEIDTLCPAPQRVQENDESDAEPAPRRRLGRKMARLLCSHAGCESLAAMGGLCKKHNPGCHCTHPGCNLVAYTKKLCRNHGAEVKPRAPCRQDGCEKPSVKMGVCWEHLPHDQKHKLCTVEGCTSQARREGVCTKHGAYQTLKICKMVGCSLTVRKGGVCGRHFKGPQGEAIKRTKRLCSDGTCTNQAYIGGLCRRHGTRCSHTYCEKTVYRNGMCYRHVQALKAEEAAAAEEASEESGDELCPVALPMNQELGESVVVPSQFGSSSLPLPPTDNDPASEEQYALGEGAGEHFV